MLDITIAPGIINDCRLKLPYAQETLYKQCYGPFMKICLRYAPSYDDASEILQDSWIKIFTKIDSYNNTGNFVGWMRRIVVNTAIDNTRTKKKDTNIDIEKIQDVADETEEAKFVVDEKHLLKLIRELPVVHAQVFNLFVMEEYSHEEIAKTLGITVASSKWYLFSARKTLKENVSKIIQRE